MDLELKPGLYYASKNSTALELAKIMRNRNIGLLPIVDGPWLVGVVTERDLVTRLLAEGKDPAETLASEIMTPQPIVVDAKDGWETVLGKMKHIDARHMLVMSDGFIVGVLSLRDFLFANIDARQVELTKAHDALSVDSRTDAPAASVDLDVWSCEACGYLAFGRAQPEKCLGCGLEGTLRRFDKELDRLVSPPV